MSTTITGVVTNGVVVPSSPLPEGAKVEVLVAAPEKPAGQFGSALEFLESLPFGSKPRRLSMLEFLETLPPGPRVFETWEEYEQHLREEKNAWER